MSIKNITGRKFGKLLVLGRVQNKWLCKCDCGNVSSVSTTNQLTSGNTKSCGCFRRANTGNFASKHGQARPGNITQEYCLWNAAKQRAKAKGVTFNLEIEDIIIPEFCPVFPRVRLQRNKRGQMDSSPSLDRLVADKGYTKDNVRVISHRANAIKNSASLLELQRVSEWLAGELQYV